LIFELLVQFVVEVFGQLLFEVAIAFGWESVRDSVRSRERASPLLAASGHFLTGCIAGVLSLLLYRERVTQDALFPGISLILSPLGTGLVMQWLGDRWGDEKQRPMLFTFQGGATFAFGMALVRFLYMRYAR
jgi:hypothetical protein